MAIGYAVLTVIPSARGFGKNLSGQIDPQMAKAGRSGGSKLSGALGGVLKKSAIGVGVATGGILATALVKGFGRLSAIEEAKAKLSGLGNSTETVATIMDNALGSVKGTAFGLGDAATVAASTVAAGVKPGKDLQRTLSLTGDAATIAGTSISTMGSIFNKVATANKIQGDTINQLNDSGIPIIQLLAKEMGKSSDEVRDLASKGEVDFATFQDAMEAGLGGAALKSGETFKGAFANMGAALGRFGAGLLTDLLPIAKQVFGSVTGFLDTLTAKVGPFADAFAAKIPGAFKAIGEAISSLTSGGGGKLKPLIDAFKGFITNVVNAGIKVGPALAKIAKALAPIAKVTIAAGIVALTVAFDLLGPAIETAADIFADAVDLIDDNQTTFKIVAGVITTVLIPAMVKMAITATISGAETVAVWLLIQASAIKATAITVAQLAIQGAKWVWLGVTATVSAIRIAAAWLIAKAPVVGTIILYGVAFLFIAAGWIATGVASMAGAIAVAAAWLIAIWPIALVIAAVALVVFFVIKYWDEIKEAVQKGAAFVGEQFDKVKDKAGDLVDWIKGIPGKIGALAGKFKSVGGDLINAFVDGLKNAGGVISGISGNVWNAVKSLLNGAITKINAALEFEISIPGPNIYINPPNIPHLADGGLIKASRGGTLAVLAEAGENEWAVPESKADAFARARLGGGTSSGTNGIVHIAREDLEWLAQRQAQIVLDGSQRVADGTVRQASRAQAGTRQTTGLRR